MFFFICKFGCCTYNDSFVLRGVGFAEWFRRENSVEIAVFDSVLTLKLFDFQCSVFLVSAILRYRYD